MIPKQLPKDTLGRRRQRTTPSPLKIIQEKQRERETHIMHHIIFQPRTILIRWPLQQTLLNNLQQPQTKLHQTMPNSRRQRPHHPHRHLVIHRLRWIGRFHHIRGELQNVQREIPHFRCFKMRKEEIHETRGRAWSRTRCLEGRNE
jgi:uncharacterized protein VirK/YbjX